jgi:hypothetical protein
VYLTADRFWKFCCEICWNSRGLWEFEGGVGVQLGFVIFDWFICG